MSDNSCEKPKKLSEITPPVLYKYRNWSSDFNKDLLLKKEIFLSSPDTFNDPFDINIKINVSGWSQSEKIDYINKVFDRHINESENLRPFLLSRKQEYLNNPDKYLNEYCENLLSSENGYRNTTEIFCLAKSWESIPMWGYYGDSHKGYCMGFKEKVFNKETPKTIFPVSYYCEYPDIKPTLEDLKDYYTLMTSKSKSWSHEEEWRYFKPKSIGEKIKYTSDDVEEIILGVNISGDDQNEIITFCRKELPNAKIYKATLHEQKFELKRDLIL